MPFWPPACCMEWAEGMSCAIAISRLSCSSTRPAELSDWLGLRLGLGLELGLGLAYLP